MESIAVKELAPAETVFKSVKLRPQYPEVAERIARELAVSAVAARVLAARGFDIGKKLSDFLEPTLKEGLPAPADLKNLARGCALVKRHVEGGSKIAICCDFDVDGLSGGAQAHHFFNSIGVVSHVYVPDRFEDGYGLNTKMVQAAHDAGCKLLIAIDFGTTNAKELTLARQLGMETLVIDHHHVEKNPPADVFINPQQQGCGFGDKILCASGLVWYLIAGLRKNIPVAEKIDPKSYLDLACLGTICDMVPLVGANRVIAKRGLELLEGTERAGLRALKQVAGVKGRVTCTDVSFGIGPRLNAAGRMVHGALVIELLSAADPQRAAALARQLNELNLNRQETENQVKLAAVEYLKERGGLADGIVVWDPAFHTGVIGIVAQRLVESFYRPAVVLGRDGEGIYKGSVRGVKGFNVVKALSNLGEHLLKFGGHEGAGGLSIEEERLDAFAEAFSEECARQLEGRARFPTVEADTVARFGELNFELIDQLSRFAPYGMGNPGPVLLFEGVEIKDLRVLKDAHLKVVLSQDGIKSTAFLWRCTFHPALKRGAVVNIAARPERNSFQGSQELQLNIQAATALD